MYTDLKPFHLLLKGFQEQHQGVDATIKPRAPAHRPDIPPIAGIALGLAVFGAAVWSLVTVWKRKDNKLHRTAQHAQQPPPSSSRESSSDSRHSNSDSSSDSSRDSSGASRARAKSTPLAPEVLAKVRSRIVCRQFAKQGKCRYGDDCRYAHVRDPQELKQLRTDRRYVHAHTLRHLCCPLVRSSPKSTQHLKACSCRQQKLCMCL